MLKYLHSAKITVEGKQIFLRSTTDKNGLDFDFTITRKRFDPFADININFYNLSNETIEILNKKDSPFRNTAKIKCEAGYQGDNKLIFSGTVYKVRTKYIRGEKITSVVVSSFNSAVVDQDISVSYKVAPKFSKVLTDLSAEAGVDINLSRLSNNDDKNINEGGFSFTGTIQEFLTNYASQNTNITVEYYNDIVIVSSLNLNKTPIIENLSAKNGLILTPVLTDQNLIKASALFNPNYQISSFISIESDRFIQSKVEGEIYKLQHDFTTARATSTIEILPLGQQTPRNNLGVGP